MKNTLLLLGLGFVFALGGCAVRASVPGVSFMAGSSYERPYRHHHRDWRDHGRWHRRPYDDRY